MTHNSETPAPTEAELEARADAARLELFADPRPPLPRQIELRALIGQCTADILRMRRALRMRNAGVEAADGN